MARRVLAHLTGTLGATPETLTSLSVSASTLLQIKKMQITVQDNPVYFRWDGVAPTDDDNLLPADDTYVIEEEWSLFSGLVLIAPSGDARYAIDLIG